MLKVNGATRQDGDLADMILDAPGVIAELSRYVTLAAGDLIFTGTMAGARRVTHLHWGGGTPSILGEQRLAAIVDTIAKLTKPASGDRAPDVKLEGGGDVTSLF